MNWTIKLAIGTNNWDIETYRNQFEICELSQNVYNGRAGIFFSN